MRFLILPVLILANSFLASSCGGVYTVDVKPVDVNVKADITFGDLMAGFKIQCRRENPSATEEEISGCASLKFSNLIADIDKALNS